MKLRTCSAYFAIFFFAAFFSLPVYSQDTLKRKPQPGRIYLPPISSFNRDSIAPAGRNEIYVNISPVMTVLLGGVSFDSRWSLMYKRVLNNPRRALRFGFIYYRESEIEFFSGEDVVYYRTSDTSRFANILQVEKRKRPQLSFGIESRSKKFNHRWSTFFAADLIAGFFNQDFTLTEHAQYQLPTGEWEDEKGFREVVDHKTAFSWYAGISINGGLRYAFNKHWMFAGQAGIDFFYITRNRYERGAYGYFLKHANAGYIDFYTNALINEFALVYRF
ncbi:MAG TPA: hypothetical protein VI731_04730 [Bacteroidia bacterium]|nr:hypothetical protein [Bacteroidia bacterium]